MIYYLIYVVRVKSEIYGDEDIAWLVEVDATQRLLPLLLLRHSAMSLTAQEECLATSPYLLHAIVVRLHVLTSNVVILTPETADTVGV